MKSSKRHTRLFIRRKYLCSELRNSHVTTGQRGGGGGGEVSVAKRQFGGSPWLANVRSRPDYIDEESQEEKRRRDRKSELDNFGRRCRRVEVAWRLVSAAIPWRIDRARHADWRHDHGLSQTASTWTARWWSRGRRLIVLRWLVNYGEPLHAIGPSEARRMITHTTSTACRANRPEKASLHYQTFNGYVP